MMRKILNVVFSMVLGGGMGFQLSAEPLYERDVSPLDERQPMLQDELITAFNNQIKNEMEGANIYLAMSQHFYLKSLDGFGHWYAQQYFEEINHARILMDFLKRKNAPMQLGPIAAVPMFLNETPLNLLNESLNLEKLQTERIHVLHETAQKLGASQAAVFLQWFINEQVQEEDMFQGVYDHLELVGTSPDGLLLVNTELAARPAAVIWTPGQPLP